MRLLFLYIESYRSHEKRALNFDANYRFSYEKNVLRFHRGHVLPNGFFYVQTQRAGDSVVENVSAIIGPNGSGKTSIISFMGEMFSGCSREDVRFLYVIRKKVGSSTRPTLICRHNLGEGLDDSEPAAEFQKRWDMRRIPFGEKLDAAPMNVVYYSPFFTTQKVLGEEGFADISTARYLREAKDLDDYKQKETGRLLDLMRRIGWARRAYSEETPLPAPNSILIRPRKISFGTDVAQYQEIANGLKTLRASTDPILRIFSAYLKSLCGLRRSEAMSDSRFGGYLSFLAKCGRDASVAIEERSEGRGLEDDPEKPFYRWRILHGTERWSVRERLVTSLSQFGIGLADDLYVPGLNEAHTAFVRLLGDCAELLAMSDDGRSGVIRSKIRSPKQSRLLYQILADWQSLRESVLGEACRELIEVEVGNMSTGEMAYLTLMARLNDIFDANSPRFVGECRDLLLFLDECETTLHPAWQRQLVYNIIWFFENFTQGMRVHVIFASHSPMLLSDMPLGNVTFLDDRVPDPDRDKTFGANVFDLYRASFGLDEGVFGMIAKRKLDALLRKIRRGEPFDEPDRQTANLFGNRLISHYLVSYQR